MEQLGPIPSMLPKHEVHRFAETIADKLGYAPGDPMEPLLSKIGGRLSDRDIFSDAESADSIKVDPQGYFTIYVSSLTSVERERFTIAHEMGHYFLHFPIFRKKHPGMAMVATRWVDDTNASQRRAEWEANWFAAAFLMPAAQFKQAAHDCNNEIEELAFRFSVSLHAARIRLQTI